MTRFSKLSAVSYLAPNWFGFYQSVVAYLARRLKLKIHLSHSENDALEDLLLRQDQIDLAFICGLPFDRYQQIEPDRFQILAAPVMQATRYQNLPVYFADVIVRVGSPYINLPDLAGRVFCYNDRGSNSGYNLLRHHLWKAGEPNHFFGRTIQSGSHQQSIRTVISGKADCATIDSTVLEKELQDFPELATQLQVIESIRSPMPPIVVARSLGVDRIQQLQTALLTPDAGFQATLKAAGIRHYVPITLEEYGLAQQYDVVTEAAYELS